MMSKYEEKPCVCGNHYIQNRTKWLCAECVFKMNHEGMNKVEYYKKRSKCYKPKKTGELDLFKQIWEIRPHYCTNCGKWLGSILNVSFFSHIRSKGACPELRLDPNNIELLCVECHQKHEFGDRTKL